MSNSFFSRIPVVTKNLIIINFIVWLAMFVFPAKFGVNLENVMGLHYVKAGNFNPVQFVTYMFMHSRDSLAHIFFNMFTLFMFGSVLEHTLGSARFLFYYLSVGIGAALFQEITWALTWEDNLVKVISMGYHVDFPEARMMLAQLQSTPDGLAQITQYLNRFVTIGASGAVYGVLLAFGMIYPNMPMYLMFIPIPIKAKYMVIGMGVIELLIGLTSGQGDGVAHFVHLGGMLFGLAIILYWKKKGLFNGVGY
ncbi:MAG: rhomboid family intramembrane serine protease [Duncaniella sp.]|nr:rhomboid family intramembrane serine protease [Duncaniella sp.]